jgi:hypothetical protein
LLQHRIAQRSAQALEEGGPREEAQLLGRETDEMLGPQVLGDESMVAGEVLRRERRAAGAERAGV